MLIPTVVERLIEIMKKIPGIGHRTAERYIFFLLRNKEVMKALYTTLEECFNRVVLCSNCHYITDEDPCKFCKDKSREGGILIVVEKPEDVYLFEKMGIIKEARYHVTGGVISPIEGVYPQNLYLNDISKRLEKERFKEVIFALSPTFEGEATVYYIYNQLKGFKVKFTRIARGVPPGADLSLTDIPVLREALLSRSPLKYEP